jgi:hypothetical protein
MMVLDNLVLPLKAKIAVAAFQNQSNTLTERLGQG